MEFSDQYKTILNSVFNNAYRANSNIRMLTNLNLTSEDLNKRFLKFNINTEVVEIPTCIKSHIENLLSKHYTQLNDTPWDSLPEIAMPLCCNARAQTRRTADTIIKDFFYQTNNEERLHKITTNKGEIYYGCKGLILDKDWIPIFMATVICKNISSGHQYRLEFKDAKIYLHPKVFLDTNSLINKTIIKKVLPYYLTNTVPITSNMVTRPTVWIKPQICIQDTSNWFTQTKQPTSINTMNEELNQILVDNVDDIIKTIN